MVLRLLANNVLLKTVNETTFSQIILEIEQIQCVIVIFKIGLAIEFCSNQSLGVQIFLMFLQFLEVGWLVCFRGIVKTCKTFQDLFLVLFNKFLDIKSRHVLI